MKLYEVIRTFYVMAKDEAEAKNYIPKDPLACTNEVFEAHTVYHEWWDAIPFGEQPGDKTCGDIIIARGTPE